MKNGTALLQNYFASIHVRGDTKSCLLLGACAGVVVVAVIAAYPGKPIDYGGAGEWLFC